MPEAECEKPQAINVKLENSRFQDKRSRANRVSALDVPTTRPASAPQVKNQRSALLFHTLAVRKGEWFRDDKGSETPDTRGARAGNFLESRRRDDS